MTVTSTIDLNATIAATGFARAGRHGLAARRLAHPRGIAITNNGDASDADETVYVTEWFAVRTAPEIAGNPSNSDTNWKGLLYAVPVAYRDARAPSICRRSMNTGFNDAKGERDGLLPQPGRLRDLETGRRPRVLRVRHQHLRLARGPGRGLPVRRVPGQRQLRGVQRRRVGVPGARQGRVQGQLHGRLRLRRRLGGRGLQPADGELRARSPPTPRPPPTPASPSSISPRGAPTATTTTLDTAFTTAADIQSGIASTRMPLLPTDVDFKARLRATSPPRAPTRSSGSPSPAAPSPRSARRGNADNGNFIDVAHHRDNAAIRLPIGVAVSTDEAFAFVANDGTRERHRHRPEHPGRLDQRHGATCASTGAARGRLGRGVGQLNGKRFFNTGLGPLVAERRRLGLVRRRATSTASPTT